MYEPEKLIYKTSIFFALSVSCRMAFLKKDTSSRYA
jgi:hypothetical protein